LPKSSEEKREERLKREILEALKQLREALEEAGKKDKEAAKTKRRGR